MTTCGRSCAIFRLQIGWSYLGRLRLSLSAPVTAAQTTQTVDDALVEIDIAVPHPNPVTWLVHPAQVTTFQRVFRETLARIRERVPHCRRIHLFAAVPMPCAVAAGQAINPGMNVPVQLCEFDYRNTPPYAPVLLLDSEATRTRFASSP